MANDTDDPSTGGVIASAILAILAGVFWLLATATLADLGRSDAAGNALAQAYAAIIVIVLWVLLAIIAIIAAVKGAAPKWSLAAAAFLIPGSGVATMIALDLLARPYEAPYRWPLVTPALVPPLVVAFCFWALLPSLRAIRVSRATPAIVWSVVALLCLAVWPLTQIRANVVERFMESRVKYTRDFASVPPGAPLWEWTPFLNTPDQTRVAATLDKIKHLERRQSDAETMLERGDFPLGFLGSFDLTPNASLCDKARAALRRKVEPLVLKAANAKPYREIAEPVADAVAAMAWLVGYDCPCDAESIAWENAANAYRDPSYDVYRLVDLRKPDQLGRTLRRDPERFAMLNEKSHLKAWLKFADEKDLRAQALAGARKLDHRTADAVEMLYDKYDISAPWKVLRYLPALDFQATPEFCNAALSEIRADLSRIHRPKADDPRPYRELLDRLGNDAAQLPALQWLAAHSCDAEAGLTEAQALIAIYQDSPERSAMLASLEQLRRKQ